ncbi:MAG: tetratricopeptide repeat protein, partial [Anaerolineales bacterium]|nr:tetratricopeptide repeat protein [Anaerolineales bacterium]
IDQLPEVEKTTLKVASIIGRMFRASWIWGSYPLAGDPPTIRHHLRNLRRLDLTPLHDTYPEPTYLFKHITTQEVAYESMAYSTRATIHGNLGHYLEETYADQLTQYVDVLAHHYGRSDNQEKQIVYFQQAGDVAKETYNNDAAVAYYERLLPLLPAEQQAAVQLELGQVQQLIGAWATAEQLYLQALEGAQQSGEITTAAACALALGSLLYLSRPESDEALNWLHQAQNWFTELDNQQGIGQVLEQLSFILSQRGEYPQAIAYAEEQLAIAQTADDPLGLSAAYRNIGNCYFVQGAFNEAKIAFEQSITTAEAAQDRQGTILSANNLAGVYWFQGDYDQSLAQLQKVQAIAQTIGHREIMGVSAGNAGTVYRQVGMAESALACYQTALDVGIALGDWGTIATSLGNLAELYIDQEQYDVAEPLLARSLALFQTLEAPFTACYFLQRQAALLHTLQRTAEAAQINAQAIKMAEQVQRQDVLLSAQLLALQLQVAEQQITPSEAAVQVRAWLTAEPPWPPAEQAQLHQLLWQLTDDLEAKKQAAALYQSLYHETPNIAYHKQYQQLTGKTLTSSQTIRPWAGATTQARPLAQLLAQVGVVLGETKTAA